MTPDAEVGLSGFGKTVALRLGRLVALLAMKRERALLPVSSALWKRLLRRCLANGPEDLGEFERRYLFLGDERMLLAELERQPAATLPIRLAVREAPRRLSPPGIVLDQTLSSALSDAAQPCACKHEMSSLTLCSYVPTVWTLREAK